MWSHAIGCGGVWVIAWQTATLRLFYQSERSKCGLKYCHSFGQSEIFIHTSHIHFFSFTSSHDKKKNDGVITHLLVVSVAQFFFLIEGIYYFPHLFIPHFSRFVNCPSAQNHRPPQYVCPSLYKFCVVKSSSPSEKLLKKKMIFFLAKNFESILCSSTTPTTTTTMMMNDI